MPLTEDSASCKLPQVALQDEDTIDFVKKFPASICIERIVTQFQILFVYNTCIHKVLFRVFDNRCNPSAIHRLFCCVL